MAGTTSATGKWVRAEDLWTGTIGTGGVADGTVTTIPLASVTGLTDGKTYIVSIDRVDANGTTTSSKREVVKGVLSGTNLINCTRGVEGTAQAHSAGAVVEILMTAAHWNDLLDGLEAEHNPDDGTHTDITATSITTTGNATIGGDAAVTGAITGASATTTGDVDAAGAVKADTVSEHTLDAGVTIDGVKMKDSQVVVPTPLHTATDGSTITFDLAISRNQTVTLGDNRTLAVSNAQTGMPFIITLKQDGTGNRTVTWWSGIQWAGGSAPTLTTTANKADTFGFVYMGGGVYYGYIVGQNI